MPYSIISALAFVGLNLIVGAIFGMFSFKNISTVLKRLIIINTIVQGFFGLLVVLGCTLLPLGDPLGTIILGGGAVLIYAIFGFSQHQKVAAGKTHGNDGGQGPRQ